MPTEQHTAARPRGPTPGKFLREYALRPRVLYRLAEGARAVFSHGAWLKNTAVLVKYDGEQERRVVAVQLTEG